MKIHFKFLLVLVAIVGTIPFSFSQRGGASNPTITVQTDIQHITDEITSGEIDYEILVSTGWTRSTRINSLKIINSDGQLVHTHAGSGPLGLAQGLPIGYYDFTGSITVQNSAGYYTSMLINERVWIGREAMWCDSKDMNVAFDNTITRNASSITYAGARSNNIVQEGDGWIQLNGKYGSGSDSRSFLVLGNTQDISSFSPNAQQQFIEFYSTSSGNGIRIKYKSTGGSYLYTTISNNPSDAVRLIRNGSNVSVQIRNNKYASFNFPTSYTGVLNIGVFANENGDGFKNVITSLPGGSALASWDGDLNTGIINVDISSLGIAGPYRYFIAEGEIPNSIDLYNHINNNVGLTIPASSLLTGNDNHNSKSFTGLSNNEYYVAVFDNSGERIYSKKVYTQPSFEFESQSGLLANGKLIKSPNSNGYGTLNLFAVDGGNEKFEVIINKDSKDLFIGVAGSNVAVNTFSKLQYGFYLKNGLLYSIENGQQSPSGVTVSEKTQITLEIINGKLYLKSSNGINQLYSLTPNYELQTSVGVNRGGELTLKVQKWKWKKYKVNIHSVTHLDCSESESGSFVFSVTRPGSLISALTFNIKDENGTIIYNNGNGSTNSSIVVSQSTTGQFISPGVYTVYGTVSSGGSFSSLVYVGYEVQWEDELAYSFIPNTYSINRQVDQNGVYSFAKSKNVGLDTDYGWIEFSPVTNGPSGSFFPEEHNFLKIAGQSANASLPNVNDDFLYFGQLGNGAVLMFSFVNGIYDLDIINSAARVRTLIQNNMVRVYVQNSSSSNYSLKSTFSAVDRSHMLRPMSLAKHNGFENVITSFPCLKQRYELLSFAKLRASNDGSYVNGAEGKLKIYFKENYEQLNTQNLDIKIYDASRTQYTVSNTDIHSFDDNRYELDLSNLNLVDGGYYTLEVTVSKDVRQYLKFKYND